MYFAKKKKKKGFTLIELLVVIAIIGILATIVVVNVNSARNKAKDAVIIGGLDSYRATAEIQYDTNGGNYNSVSVCSTTSVPDYNRVYTSLASQGATITCNVNATSFAAQATLAAGGYYCVDSTGTGKKTGSSIGATTVCP
jgi:prepilin-type N-terminal cleavage/methylation domain-containing protein